MQPDPAAGDFPAPSRIGSRGDLQDPLTFCDGSPVEDRGDWAQRREELTALFRHYMYGHAPAPPAIEATTDRTEDFMDAGATLLDTTVAFPDLPSDAPTIQLATVLPDVDSPVPLILSVNKRGNHAAFDDPTIVRGWAAEDSEWDRGAATEKWCVEHILERGYGFATFHCDDVDPDRDDFDDGVHPHYEREDLATVYGRDCPVGSEWGTIGAWAWGMQRCVDHLRSVDRVRPEQIAVTGHSRRGKTALLAGATDERIGLVIPHQPGTGGTPLHRDNDQESITDITSRFPHWFADRYHGFSGRPQSLPFDQHLLVALVAPRPLLDTEGARDYWINPGKALDSIRAAAPVWDFLGADGMQGDGLVHQGQELTAESAGDLVQYRRETRHVLTSGYWEGILDFVDLHVDPRPPA
jgi:hypothetical protein